MNLPLKSALASATGHRPIVIGGVSTKELQVQHGAWRTVLLLSATNFCSFFDRFIPTMLFIPLQRELHLTDVQLGVIAGPAFALTYLLCSLPVGVCADRFDRRWLVVGALAAWSAMMLGCGLATGFLMLVVFRAGIGLGEAVIIPCASSIIGDLFGPRVRPLAFGVFFTSGASAILFSFLIGAFAASWLSRYAAVRLPVVGVLSTWRLTLIASGALGFVLLPLVATFLREPERHSRKAPRSAESAAGLISYLVREWRVCLAIIVGVPIVNAGVYTFLGWMAVFFFRVHHWNASKAGLQFALTCGVTALIGSLLLGNLPGLLARYGVRSPVLTACLIVGVGVNALGAMAMLVSDPMLALALLAVAFLGFMGASIFALSMINDVVPTEFRATFTGLTIVGIGLLTGGFGPVLVGIFTQHVFTRPDGIAAALCTVWCVALVLGVGLIASARGKYDALTTRLQATSAALARREGS